MKGLYYFLLTFLYVLPLQASNRACANAADGQDLVHVRYNYGTLGLDVTKTNQEISNICHGDAAGCFHRNLGYMHSIKVSDKEFQARSEKCAAPEIEVTYDFSGAVIYVTKDYPPCATRAVFRHELQHFMIWKTSREWFLKDLRYSLKQAAIKQAVSCPNNGLCRTNSYHAIQVVAKQVENRWSKIEEQQHTLLDDIDHSDEYDVNYTVCTPYSLEVNLF